MILFNIIRRDLLIGLMVNSITSHSFEFFKQWFYSFLLFDEEMNEVNKREYLDLLQHWSKQFAKSDEIIMKILAEIDQFANALQNQTYRSIFINYMVTFCFQQSKFKLISQLKYRILYFFRIYLSSPLRRINKYS